MSSHEVPDGSTQAGLNVVLAGLCVTEIVSWGILYYAFPILSPRILGDTGWSAGWTTAAFSAALVVAALVGVPVGRLLDRRGPRLVMTSGSALAVLSVLLIAWSPHLVVFAAGWLLAGVAMSGVLYQPAFAALVRWFGHRRLQALTVLTLVAGLASTVFAPLTAALSDILSWRQVYLVLAVALAAVTIPIHALALRRPWPAETHGGADTDVGAGHHVRSVVRSAPFGFLLAGLTLGSLAMYAVLINLVPLLTERQMDLGLAAWVLGLGGVGQVAGRLFYSRIADRLGIRIRTLLIFGLAALTTAGLALVPGPVSLLILIAFLAGIARGIATLLQATAVPDRWGSRSYGRINGILAAPITIAGAIAPWFGATLAGITGSYARTFLALTAIAAVAVVLLAFSVPKQQKASRLLDLADAAP